MKNECKDCEYYLAGRGKYGTGICTSKNSTKRNKKFVLKSETCIRWKNRKDGGNK